MKNSESESDSDEMMRSIFKRSDSVCGTSELNRLETQRQRIRVLTSEDELKIRRIRESGSRSKPSIFCF